MGGTVRGPASRPGQAGLQWTVTNDTLLAPGVSDSACRDMQLSTADRVAAPVMFLHHAMVYPAPGIEAARLQAAYQVGLACPLPPVRLPAIPLSLSPSPKQAPRTPLNAVLLSGLNKLSWQPLLGRMPHTTSSAPVQPANQQLRCAACRTF